MFPVSLPVMPLYHAYRDPRILLPFLGPSQNGRAEFASGLILLNLDVFSHLPHNTHVYTFCLTWRTESLSFQHSVQFSLVQFSLVAQSIATLCDPMDCSTPGLPVHHQLPESTQTHIHWVTDAIQPSHPLSSPFPPALNLFQHQGLGMSQLFAIGGQSIGVSASASVLPMNTRYWSPLGWTGWISLQSKRLSRVFSNTTVQKHQFFSAQLSV